MRGESVFLCFLSRGIITYMKNNKKQVQSRWLKKLMRVHIIVTGLSLSAYFLVAFFDPGFLSYDIRQKYHTIAAEILTVSATVLDVPVSPVVTGISLCESSMSTLSNHLDWADDINTYTYDISRDGQALVSGLSLSEYSDNSVVIGTTYTYVVTAHGPMGPGFAMSNSISLSTLSVCGDNSLSPKVSIYLFDGKNISTYSGIPSITHRRPVFIGTTNIPYAVVQIVVGPPSNFVAQLNANINGYFSWQPPFDLSPGVQVFTVTAIDPNDSFRQSSTSLQFEIRTSTTEIGASNIHHSNGSNNTMSPKTIETVVPAVAVIVPSIVPSNVDFSLSVVNQGKKIFQGEGLNVSLFVRDIAQEYENTRVPVRFSIVDFKGEIITSMMSEELLRKGETIQKQLDTPVYVSSGDYSVQAEILLGETNVSRIDGFTITDVPFISLGGGAFITYAEIVQNMGWIVLTLMILLLLWLFMFMREYGMYLHALRHITERHLMNAGLMTRRKGVIE